MFLHVTERDCVRSTSRSSVAASNAWENCRAFSLLHMLRLVFQTQPRSIGCAIPRSFVCLVPFVITQPHPYYERL